MCDQKLSLNECNDKPLPVALSGQAALWFVCLCMLKMPGRTVRRRSADLTDRLDLRLSCETRERLERAIALTPGVASCAGVIRLAVDRYLSEVLADSSA